ncbi:hypothetical protein HUJ04_011388 [Dendroctonus ponderosae]|nr:hypothetical protein HUJ04_011388 [Dendroctonus ponderosae]
MSSDPNDLTPLTPNHLLIGKLLITPPDPLLNDVKTKRLSRFEMLQQINQSFWKRWFHHLQKRVKWKTKGSTLKLGTMVVLKNNLPPCRWLLGKIIEAHPRLDGEVRVVSVKTQHGTFKRAINKVSPLPMASEQTASMLTPPFTQMSVNALHVNRQRIIHYSIIAAPTSIRSANVTRDVCKHLNTMQPGRSTDREEPTVPTFAASLPTVTAALPTIAIHSPISSPMAAGSGYSPASSPFKHMPEILQGSASLWYRTNHTHWHTWTDFIRDFQSFFFPVNYVPTWRWKLADDCRSQMNRPLVISPTSRHLSEDMVTWPKSHNCSGYTEI